MENEYELNYKKSFEGYLKSRKKLNWEEYSVIGAIYLIMEYSIPPNRAGKILEGRIIDEFGLTPSGISDYDTTISNGKGRIEIKTSVMNIDTNRYCITNLREFKDFDYYLFCLIEPDYGGDREYRRFKPYYYLIPKKYIDNNPHIKFYFMNSGGGGKRFSFKRDDDTHRLLDRLNVLTKIQYNFDKDSHNVGPYLGECRGFESNLEDFIKHYDKFTHAVEYCEYSHYCGLYVPSFTCRDIPLTLNNAKKILKETKEKTKECSSSLCECKGKDDEEEWVEDSVNDLYNMDI